MADVMFQELVNSANILMAGPNEVNAEQRQAAEKVFLNFQKMNSPFGVCKHLLEKCDNDYVLFQTVTLFKNAIIRESLSPEDISSLKSYLLQYITERVNLKSYVREQITMVVAIIVKRSCVLIKSTEREKVLNDVSELIRSGNTHLQTIGCSILTALLNEYASSIKASNLGLTWETHLRAKKNFENVDMMKIFQFCVEGLSQIENTEQLGAEMVALVQKLLSISSQILMWNFQRIPIPISRRMFGIFEGQQVPPFRPPTSWSVVILKPEIIHTFFKIHWKIRENQELSHLSLQCLSQLISLNGEIFRKVDVGLRYLTTYLQNFIQFLNSCTILDHEAFGISSIFSKMILFQHMRTLSSLPPSILEPFFFKITEITCQLTLKAAQEESTSEDDRIYMEAFGQMLEAWFPVLINTEMFKGSIKNNYYVEVFNCYLRCHLSAPDGTRGQDVGGNDEEIDDIEEDDRKVFGDHLIVIGYFGRQILHHSLPLLIKLLEERSNRLHGQLQRIIQQSSGMKIEESSIMTMLCEDIHWLLMISCHLLTKECKGETVHLYPEIVKYSKEQCKENDVSMISLQVLGSPNEKVSEIPGGDSADHVIRLISAIFRLCEIERQALQVNLCGLLSPEVGTTLMWFLRYWVPMFLFVDAGRNSDQMSPTFQAAFGPDTDASTWTINFILNKICSNIVHWSSEPSLMDETIMCLLELVSNPKRSTKIYANHDIWNLVSPESFNKLTSLQSRSKRRLFHSIALVDLNGDSNSVSRLDQFFKALWDRFQSIVSQPNFSINFKDEPIKSEIINFIEAMIGIVEASNSKCKRKFVDLPLLILDSINKILEIYHNYNDVVEVVLEFYSSLNQRTFNTKEEHEKLYSSNIQMIEIYARHNCGKKTKEVNVEEEQFEDMKIMLGILNDLVCKGISNQMFGGDILEEKCSSADVALYGLNVLMPMLTGELLKFPGICKLYYKLINFTCQIYPDKVMNMPPYLLNMILQSLELGLSSFTADITLNCFEVIADLATDLIRRQEPTPDKNLMRPFLKIVLNLILFQPIAMDSSSAMSVAVFTLICSYQNDYRVYVEELINQQGEENKPRIVEAFNTLTKDLDFVVKKLNKMKFRDNFEKFIIKVQGILCIK